MRRKKLHSLPLVILVMTSLSVYHILIIAFSQEHSTTIFELEGTRIEPRQLSNATNQTVQGSLFPPDLFTLKQRQMGAIILHVIGVIYMLGAVAIVSDEFFIPSLEVTTQTTKISNDVAGATLMAAGGSAPEFFTHLFGTFFSRNSIGFGTIVGSAVFNILFVIGACGMVAKKPLELRWWPLLRDTAFYAISLAVLIAFFQGGSIEWYESLVLFLLYCLYVLFMFGNGRAERQANKQLAKLKKKISCCKQHVQPSTSPPPSPETGPVPNSNLEAFSQEPETETTNQRSKANLSVSMIHLAIVKPQLFKRTSVDSGFQSPSEAGYATFVDDPNHQLPQTKSLVPSVFFTHTESSTGPVQQSSNMGQSSATGSSTSIARVPIIRVESVNSTREEENVQQEVEGAGKETEKNKSDNEHDDSERLTHIKPPKRWYMRILYVIFFPIIILLFFTMPDVTKPRWRWFFLYVFVVSILWIGGFTYLLIWWTDVFGRTAMIPPSILGVTFLAAGTSIPDLITSVIVARKGRGVMAVSSSIGSNIFDVTFGLPVPWLLFSAINNGQPIQVLSSGLFCSVILLVGMLLVAVGLIPIFRWKLGKPLGVIYLIAYFLFITMEILLELSIPCTIS